MLLSYQSAKVFSLKNFPLYGNDNPPPLHYYYALLAITYMYNGLGLGVRFRANQGFFYVKYPGVALYRTQCTHTTSKHGMSKDTKVTWVS